MAGFSIQVVIVRRVSELPLPDSPYEMMLVGLSRDGEAPETPLGDVRIEPGGYSFVDFATVGLPLTVVVGVVVLVLAPIVYGF